MIVPKNFVHLGLTMHDTSALRMHGKVTVTDILDQSLMMEWQRVEFKLKVCNFTHFICVYRKVVKADTRQQTRFSKHVHLQQSNLLMSERHKNWIFNAWNTLHKRLARQHWIPCPIFYNLTRSTCRTWFA